MPCQGPRYFYWVSGPKWRIYILVYGEMNIPCIICCFLAFFFCVDLYDLAKGEELPQENESIERSYKTCKSCSLISYSNILGHQYTSRANHCLPPRATTSNPRLLSSEALLKLLQSYSKLLSREKFIPSLNITSVITVASPCFVLSWGGTLKHQWLF